MTAPAHPSHSQNTGKQSPFAMRQSRISALLIQAGLDALALNPGPSLTYLTGLHFHLMERPTVALLAPGRPVTLVIPELEAGKTAALPYPVEVFTYGEDPTTWEAAFRQAALATKMDGGKIGVEPLRLRVLELRFLERSAPAAHFVEAETTLAELRLRKDETEIAAMRKAVDIAQRALQATLPQVKVGVTEREIAAELTLQLLRAGSEPEFPFTPIVSGGPNTANPHATPTNRPLAEGDLFLVDWGAAYDGYISDLTRTFAIGKIDPELERIHQIVQEANAAGRAAAGPGIAAEVVDKAARAVIEAAGYGKYFFHRTGHGIGMESHEGPYMRSGNHQILDPGMIFTVEPGIYLAGRGGVRIEDDMVITADGAESLSDLPRQLETL